MINKKRNKNAFSHGYIDPNLPVPDINERFVDACENGDYPTVTRILDSIKDFNIDVTDNLGRTALRLAVENEHLEVVQALLGRSDSPKMKEALLLAIYLGHTQIAESILKHPKYKVLNEKKFVNGDTDSFWQTPSSDDAQFSPDITPLMLAAQYNRTEIVQILLINGDRITKPHDFHCKCNECFNRFKFDSLRHAQSRLNAFRGLASESYISLASMDPILTSFELGRELRSLSTKEKYFKNEYQQLADNLSSYVCKLLNNVRGRDELEIVLNKTGKEAEEKYERLARLDLAIKFEEKPFVAHPACQQKLVEIWYTGLRTISKMNQFLTLLVVVFFIFMLPFFVLVYLVAPKSKLGRFMYQPCVKFLSHTVSYMAFILMIIISSIQFSEEEKATMRLHELLPNNLSVNYSSYLAFQNIKYKFETRNENFPIRRDRPSLMDILISIWIAGLIWQEVKNAFHYGFRDYLSSWNNIFNSIMNILYVSSFSLKYYSIIAVRMAKSKALDANFWKNAIHLNETNYDAQREIFNNLYWLNNDRLYWVAFDPINMAESLFALANLFSFTRICFLLPANQQLGPLQISLGNMISDVIKFISIFMIIFLAFMFALNNLFWYYQESVRESTGVGGSSSNAEQYFGTISATFKSMFWSLFGLGDPKFTELSPYDNKLTETFASLLFGCYHIASIIVLLNMLVASMTQSYERIIKESDVEWKFSRSKLYMEYIKDGGTLPVPFNVIPSPKSIYYFFKKIIGKIRRKSLLDKDENDPNTPRGGRSFADESHMQKAGKQIRKRGSGVEELTYIKVMQRIVKRFLLHKQRESDEVGEADFEELKQDLQMVRYEMLNDLKRSHEETVRMISHLQAGLVTIGDEIFKDSSTENSLKFKELKSSEFEMNDNVSNVDPTAAQGKTALSKHDYSLSVDSGLSQLKDHMNIRHTTHDDKLHSADTSVRSSFDNQSMTNTEIFRLSNSSQLSVEPDTNANAQASSSPGSLHQNSTKTINDGATTSGESHKMKTISINELQVITEEEEINAENYTADKNPKFKETSLTIPVKHVENGCQANFDEYDSDKKYLF